MKNYEKDYKEFWKDIIEPKGEIDKDALMRELSDYHNFLGETSRVYDELTFGRISKPNTMSFEIIREVRSSIEDSYKDAVWDDMQEMFKKSKTKEELVEQIKEYMETD